MRPLTFMAGRAGLQVPEVLAVGRFGPRRDAALVTRLPDGPALSEADEDSLSDGTLDELLLAVLRLREAGIAHGTLGAETIIVSAGEGYLPEGLSLRDLLISRWPPRRRSRGGAGRDGCAGRRRAHGRGGGPGA